MDSPKNARGSKGNLVSFFIAGACGALFQTVVLRELLSVFSGNELSICAITAFFVLGEAFGALLGGYVREGRQTGSFLSTFLLFSILFPLSIYAGRIARTWLSIPPSVSFGLGEIVLTSFLCAFPPSSIHGLFFTLSCSLYERLSGLGEKAAGRVYFCEMAGTVLGGFVSVYLVSILSSFTISFLVGLSLCLCSFFLAFQLGVGRMLIFLHLGLLVALLSGLCETRAIHSYTVRKAWEGREVLAYRNSPYQNIVVTREGEQINVFLDGVPYITLPEPDIAEVEILSHIPMLLCNNPEEVLMIGGLGGPLREIMRHPSVRRVDYVELDPHLLSTVKEVAEKLSRPELSNPKLFAHLTDGRAFVTNTKRRYDCVILSLSEPSSLERNRYFTEEFFYSVRRILKDQGVFAFVLPGSLSYYTHELKGINGTIFKSLAHVFPSCWIVPGSKNLFLAFKDGQRRSPPSPAFFMDRLKERGIQTRFLSRPEFHYLLDARRQRWVREAITSEEFPSNADFRPISFLYYLSYLALSTSPRLRCLFNALKGVRPVHLFCCLFFFLLFLSLCVRTPKAALCFCLGSTGLSSFVVETILLFSFQTVFGSIYSEIGLLLSIFMGGIAAGSLLATGFIGRGGFGLSLLVACEIGLGLFMASLFFLLPYGKGRYLTYIFLLLSGSFVGFEFPIGVSIYGKERVGRKVGPLYSSDLLGGFLGAIFAFFFLSTVGFRQSLLFLSATKATSVGLILLLRKDINPT